MHVLVIILINHLFVLTIYFIVKISVIRLISLTRQKVNVIVEGSYSRQNVSYFSGDFTIQIFIYLSFYFISVLPVINLNKDKLKTYRINLYILSLHISFLIRKTILILPIFSLNSYGLE